MKLIEDAKSHGFVCLEWNGAHHNAKWKCPIGHDFSKRASLLKHANYSCPECWKVRNKTKDGFKDPPKAKDKALEEISKAGYRLLSEYKKSTEKLILICEKGHSCQISWHNFDNGTRCVTCKFDKQTTNLKSMAYLGFKSKVEAEGYCVITPFDEYEGTRTRLQLSRPDGSVFDTCIQNTYMIGHFDADEVKKKDLEERKKRIHNKIGNGFSLLNPEEYVNQNSILKFRCNIGHVFDKQYNRYRSNHCPECNIPSTEVRWVELFKAMGIKHILHYKLEGHELDLFLPDHNIAIECCGLFFHSIHNRLYGKVIKKEQHFRKRELCEKHGIRLFTIYENDNNSPIMESIILNSLGKSKSLFAHKLVIKVVSNSDAKIFFRDNHLRGYSTSRNVGLYNGEELVCSIGYKAFADSHVEINRFATKLGHSVVGGFSKILKEVIKRTSTKHIISYLDLRYSNGSSYDKCGFIRTNVSLGWKWTDFSTTFNRLHCRANMDNRKLSEAEHANELGLYKIYDCGQAKYELRM